MADTREYTTHKGRHDAKRIMRSEPYQQLRRRNEELTKKIESVNRDAREAKDDVQDTRNVCAQALGKEPGKNESAGQLARQLVEAKDAEIKELQADLNDKNYSLAKLGEEVKQMTEPKEDESPMSKRVG